MKTNGYSVQHAQFAEGHFIQTGPVTWRENRGKGKFEFTESARDKWSVFLEDSSRKVSIHIDLHRKKIRYSDPKTPWQDQYDLLSAASVVGWLAGYAEFRRDSVVGSFLQTGPKTWKEMDENGKTLFQFVESSRDDWSVYLNDPSRRISIKIDIFRKKISWSRPRTPWHDLYDVLSARSVVGWTAGTVVFPDSRGKKCAFVQTRPKKWEERNSDPKAVPFNFNETGRKDWSVHLKDPSRNVSIELDLWRNKVRYSDPQAPWRDQYDILSAARPYPGQDATPPIVQGVAQALARSPSPKLISPGFIIKNETIWPLQIWLSQAGPLYFDVIQPGGVFVRNTGAVWFTINAAIFLDEKDRITNWDAVMPVGMIVGTVILAAVTAGAAAYAGGPALAAAGAAGVAGVKGLSSAGMLATAMAASKLVGAGFSAKAALYIGGAVVSGTGTALSATATAVLKDIFKKQNLSASKAGAYAGPPWPFRTTVTPWRVTGGPTFRQVDGKNLVEPVGGALSIRR